MKFCSFFSGIEAASVAFGPLGWKALSFSEIEPFPCAVLNHHSPDVPNHGDILKFDWSAYTGKADIVCGGPPCQAFSVAGLRKSLEDNRGNLSLAFVRAVRTIRPRWLLLENVPGMLNTKDNAFGCILAGLSGADNALTPGTPDGKWRGSGIVSGQKDGYGLAWRVLDAQHFGVPQRRRRVFVVGYLGDWRPAAEVLFEPDSVCRDSSQGGEKGQGTSGGVKSGAGTYRYQNDKDGIVPDDISASLKAKGTTTDERSTGAIVTQPALAFKVRGGV